MELHRQHRLEYPDTLFETRVLPPVDGIPRLLTLASVYWKKIEFCEKHKIDSLENITESCLEITKLKMERKPELSFDSTFLNAFMYYVHGGYPRYYKTIHNIANDFWEF